MSGRVSEAALPRLRRAGTVTIGGLLTASGVLVLPIPLLVGYLLSVIRDVDRGGTGRPGVLTTLEERYRSGVRGLAVILAYSIAPGVASLATVAAWESAASQFGPQGGLDALLAGLGAFALAVLSGLVGLAYAYALPGAVVVLATSGDDVRRALSVRHVFRLVATPRYAVRWFGIVLLGLLVGLVVLLCWVSGPGIVFVPFVAFYGLQRSARTMARATGDEGGGWRVDPGRTIASARR